MVVYFFTKPLQVNVFKKFRSFLLGHSPLSDSREHESQFKSKERVGGKNVRETDNE